MREVDRGNRAAACDITAKVEAERQAIRSEERFRYAIENSSDNFALFDADEKLVICNTKYRENSLLGAPFLSTGPSIEQMITALAEHGYVTGVDEHNKMEWIEERLAGFRTRTATPEYQLTNGQWCQSQYDGLPDGSTIARFLNVTDRKRAENILHENEQHFRDFAETSSDWFWETDEKFCLTWVSFDEHPISGASTPSLIGHRPWSWSGVEMEDRQAWNQLVETCLADKQPFRNFVVRARFPDIGVRDIRANAVPMFDEKGVFRGYRGASTDATQQIATEEQLRQAIKMEAIGQLTGGVAHDINNLLAVTLPNAQVLETELEGRDDLLAMARSIIKASEHGAELIDRLLAFSRKQSLRPKTIDLGLLCSEMNGLLGRSLGEAIKIDLITGDEARKVLADPHGVESALLNLAINARHAMPSGGTLTIEIKDVSVTSQAWAETWQGQPGAYVALRVTDPGTGMPADVLSHVFEPFFTTKAVGQGSGLGLSMVYGFAQQSGGFVAIESEQGKGTTVTIYLPKVQADQTIAKAPKPDADIGNGRGETILVVEDAPAVRNATILLLNKLGYTALSAEDGAGALEVASSGERIDLLISDMVLPGGLNGIEICNRVRELRPGLKCLFMTGYSSVSDDDLPEGTEILSKPIWMDEFDTKLRQVFDTQSRSADPR